MNKIKLTISFLLIAKNKVVYLALSKEIKISIYEDRVPQLWIEYSIS